MELSVIDKLSVVYYPDPILKQICAPVEEFGTDLGALADKMLALMHEAEGVGLAGPQVGLAIRIFVCNHTGEPGDDMVCVNPQFAELEGADVREEGCLSLPGVSVNMRRATRAVMDAFDTEGKPYRKEGVDLQARVWQHEAAHLDGHLITDNMSATDEITNRRALKQLEGDARRSRRA